ncbi:MAG: hypothetical protein GVY29_08805 [Spirochaetes bacterium]|jgi:hypothetical protein|nr:hypothetical protein [Spirochaetota bacterium]
MGRRLLVAMLVTVTSVFVLNACGDGVAFSGGGAFAGGGVDATRYREARLNSYGIVESRSFEPSVSELLVGDVQGDSAPELVLGQGTEAHILEAHDLESLRRVPLGENTLHLSTLGDVDQDGKEDLVFGSAEGGTARIVVRSGDGSALLESSFGEMVRAQTRPQFVDGSNIYFIAYSDIGIAPKLVGRLNAARGSDPQWLHHMGPVPLGLSMGTDGGIAVSLRAVSQEWRDAEPQYETDHTRSALYVLSRDGDLDWYQPFGPEIREGYRIEGQASGIRTKPFDLNGDGTLEYLMLVERMSELYGGHAALRAFDGLGRIVAEYRGPRESGASFGFFRREAEEEAEAEGHRRVVVVWKRTGTVTLLDEDLRVVSERALPGSVPAAELRQIGDFDGDGTLELLVTNGTSLVVLDEELETELSVAVPARIQAVRAYPGEDERVRFAVLADALYIFGPQDEPSATLALYSNPPGASFTMNGRPVPTADLPLLHGLAPGGYRVEAEIRGHGVANAEFQLNPGMATTQILDVGSGRSTEEFPGFPVNLHRGVPTIPAGSYSAFSVTARRDVPQGFAVWGPVDFYAGVDGGDLFLLDSSNGRFQVWDHRLELKLQSTASLPGRRYRMLPDLSGNGSPDIGVEIESPVPAIAVLETDGRPVLEKPVSRGFDTRTRIVGAVGDSLWIRIQTGYLLSPRVMYGLDVDSGEFTFAYPNALQAARLHYHNGKVYLGAFTFSNGAEIVHSDGTTERDTELYMHVLSPEGKRLPESRPFPGEDVDGWSRYFEFDSDGDGSRELFAQIEKDPTYYRGTPRVLRVHDDGSLQTVYTGPENAQFRARILPTPEGELLILWWVKLGLVEVVNGSFDVVHARREIAGRPGVPVNLDDDGMWEIPVVRDGRLVLETPVGEEVASFSLPTDQVVSYRIADLDRNGTGEVVLIGRSEVAVLSY